MSRKAKAPNPLSFKKGKDDTALREFAAQFLFSSQAKQAQFNF